MASARRSFDAVYPAESNAPARARAEVSMIAAAAGASAARTDDIRLAVSEAVTNVVRHAYPNGPGPVRVTAEIAAGELRIVVADDGCGIHVASQQPGLGIGLSLMAQVSDGLSLTRRPGGGTEARMRFTLAGVEATADSGSLSKCARLATAARAVRHRRPASAGLSAAPRCRVRAREHPGPAAQRRLIGDPVHEPAVERRLISAWRRASAVDGRLGPVVGEGAPGHLLSRGLTYLSGFVSLDNGRHDFLPATIWCPTLAFAGHGDPSAESTALALPAIAR
ncbi:MAG TPA: ATP-binding protein [Solirubrobacteraceae bacterium]|nr:ATP-binding protein [Solirubrobacteraceae bacterium]